MITQFCQLFMSTSYTVQEDLQWQVHYSQQYEMIQLLFVWLFSTKKHTTRM